MAKAIKTPTRIAAVKEFLDLWEKFKDGVYVSNAEKYYELKKQMREKIHRLDKLFHRKKTESAYKDMTFINVVNDRIFQVMSQDDKINVCIKILAKCFNPDEYYFSGKH